MPTALAARPCPFHQELLRQVCPGQWLFTGGSLLTQGYIWKCLEIILILQPTASEDMLLASGGHWLWMKVEAVDAAEHPPTCRAALWQRMVDY